MRKAIRAVQKAISTAETAKMTADEASVSLEMHNSLQRLADKYCHAGDPLKKIYGVLAPKLGLKYDQTKRLWKQEWKVVPGWVVRRIDKKIAELDALERKANEVQETLRQRQWALTHHSSDPDFYQARTATSDQSTDDVG